MGAKKGVKRGPYRKTAKNEARTNKFKKGQKAAEKWTEVTTMDILTKMWETTIKGIEDADGNPVRANDIKTIQEICLIHDVDSDLWAYLKTKFKENKIILRLTKRITDILEARMIYSGQTMDIFVMKNHYGYSDRQELAQVKKNGEDVEPIISIKQFFGQSIEIKENE